MNINNSNMSPSSSNVYSSPPSSSSYQPQPVTQQSKQASSSLAAYKVIDIGTQFCKQYYKMLSVNPGDGFKFYGKHSTLCHGTEGDLDAPVCTGSEEIRQRIMSMEYAGCRVFISTIDCQASQLGGVHVVVLGRMQMRCGQSKKFMQSILLAEQPTGFFVLNDVFRFIDTEEAQSPLSLSQISSNTRSSCLSATNSIATATNSNGTIASAQSSQQPGPIERSKPSEGASWSESSWTTEPSLSSLGNHQPQQQQHQLPSQQRIASPIKLHKSGISPPSTSSPAAAAVAVAVSSSPTASTAASTNASVPTKKDKCPFDECADAVKSSSWAEITQVQKSKWGNGVVSEARGTSVPNEQRTGSQRHSEPRHFRIRKNAAAAAANNQGSADEGDRDDHSAAATAAVITAPTTSAAAATVQRRQHNDSYNAEASVFIGGVKSRLDEPTVRGVFSKYGDIKCIEIARECLFVEFTSTESAQRALQDSTININGAELKIDKRRPNRGAYRRYHNRPNYFANANSNSANNSNGNSSSSNNCHQNAAAITQQK